MEEETSKHSTNPSRKPYPRPQIRPPQHPIQETQAHPPSPQPQVKSKARPFCVRAVNVSLAQHHRPNIGTGTFLRKYPHIFEVFTHPVRRNVCCRITQKMMGLLQEEENVVKELELENVKLTKKLLLMSVNGTLHIHALRLIRRELGLPEDFRDSILDKYSSDFKLVDLEVVALVDRGDEGLGVAKIEHWREKEYREKCLSEFETKFAFPINFPTGFKTEAGFREKLKNWQRMPYVKPYDTKEVVRVRTCAQELP